MRVEGELQSLRHAALEIFLAALKSADADSALTEKVHLDGSRLTVFDTSYSLEKRGMPIYSVAIGKGALSMAGALDKILGGRLAGGIVAAPPQIEAQAAISLQELISHGQISAEEARTGMFRKAARNAIEQNARHNAPSPSPLSAHWRVFDCGHPLPNQGSLDAARAAINLMRRAEKERALVLFLISGGGSAAFEWPLDVRITLEELRQANRALVSCGATIAEINAVRRAISAVKGGRLSTLAPHTQQVSLIVSDTNPGEEATVASGPTFAPPEDAPDARAVILRHRLEESLPDSILRCVNDAANETGKFPHGAEINHYLLLDNRAAIEAARRAAHARGFITEIAGDIIEWPVAAGSAELLSRLYTGRARNKDKAFCLISGGEFACPVQGSGTGGRNAETVLRTALDVERRGQSLKNALEAHTVILSAGTDGMDGNSPAAGAIADETSIERARASGLDAQASLKQSDAYTFFHALGDAIFTGPTGTNVRDLRVMIAI
jgi:glycerate 2-kinase